MEHKLYICIVTVFLFGVATATFTDHKDNSIKVVGGELSVEKFLAEQNKLVSGYAHTVVATAEIKNDKVLYQRIEVSPENAKKFNGQAGGLGVKSDNQSGGGFSYDSWEQVYNTTVSFWWTAVTNSGGYFQVLFFDGSSNPIAIYYGAAIGNVTGTGGGTGHWE